MVLLTGVDLIEIERVQKVLERHGQRFTQRVFTPQELEDCAGNVKSMAVRFAAKEAVSKAFGTGIGKVRFKDIEIIRLVSGAPQLKLHSRAESLTVDLGVDTWSISLSHSDSHALAFVVMIGSGKAAKDPRSYQST